MKKLEIVRKAMEERGFTVEVVADKAAALRKIESLLPEGAEVMTGSSTTLQEIGFMGALEKNAKGWKNLGAAVWAENDEVKRNKLRRQATTADYFLASVNAVTEDGRLMAVDLTGSRVTALPFAAGKVILVVGKQKITQSLEDAMQRIREVVFPKEDARALKAYGMNSGFGKWVIVERELQPGRITVVLVDEALGF